MMSLDERIKILEDEIKTIKISSFNKVTNSNLKSNDWSFSGNINFQNRPTKNDELIDSNLYNTVQNHSMIPNNIVSSNSKISFQPIPKKYTNKIKDFDQGSDGKYQLFVQIINNQIVAKISNDYGNTYTNSILTSSSEIFTPTIISAKVCGNSQYQYILIKDTTGDTLSIFSSNDYGASFNNPGDISSGYDAVSFNVSYDGSIITILLDIQGYILYCSSLNGGANFLIKNNGPINTVSEATKISDIQFSQNGKIQEFYAYYISGEIIKYKANFNSYSDSEILASISNGNHNKFLASILNFEGSIIQYLNSPNPIIYGSLINSGLDLYGLYSFIVYTDINNNLGISFISSSSGDVIYQTDIFNSTINIKDLTYSKDLQYICIYSETGDIFYSSDRGRIFNYSNMIRGNEKLLKLSYSNNGSILSSIIERDNYYFIYSMISNVNCIKNNHVKIIEDIYLEKDTSSLTTKYTYTVQRDDSIILINNSNMNSSSGVLYIYLDCSIISTFIGKVLTLKVTTTVSNESNIIVAIINNSTLQYQNFTFEDGSISYNITNDYQCVKLTTDGTKIYFL